MDDIKKLLKLPKKRAELKRTRRGRPPKNDKGDSADTPAKRVDVPIGGKVIGFSDPPTSQGVPCPLPKEIDLWLQGILNIPPEGVKSALQDINDKTTWVVAWNMVQQLSRISRLFNTLENVETTLYDPEKVEDYSTKELITIQKTLHDNLLSVLDFSRKFIAQNQEVLTELSRNRDDLIEMIRHLDQHTLRRLRDVLRGV